MQKEIPSIEEINELPREESKENTVEIPIHEIGDAEREKIDEGIKKASENDEEKLKAVRSEIKNLAQNEKQIESSVLKDKELMDQKRFLESSGSREINRLLACVKYKDTLILHVPPSRSLPLSEKLVLIKDGLKKISEILINDPSIKKIEGSSWIMEEHGSLVKRLGFEIHNVGVMERLIGKTINLFKKEKDKAYKKASMSREDFLRRYN